MKNLTKVGNPSFDVESERQILSRALLEATAKMARTMDPAELLRYMCDSLVASSSHIRLAWMALGELQADVIKPEYIVGPDAHILESLEFGKKGRDVICPMEEVIQKWESHTCDLALLKSFNTEAPLSSVMILPIGKKTGEIKGIITIYSDTASYFGQVGPELFDAFIHLANASLEQSVLLQNLKHLASHDLLTGILNRRGIEYCLEKEMARSQRHEKTFSILLFDIDRFKLINDGLGHQEGDLVLKGISQQVSRVLREEDCFGRWGGEEFICLIPESNHDQAFLLAERIRSTISSSPVVTPNHQLHATASFGIAVYPEDGENIGKLIAAADSALYQAKRAGRDRTISARKVQQDVYSLGNMLDLALRESRIVPAYQPIVDLRTGDVVAEETLARMITPEGDIIPAGQFIDAASQLQMLHRIDHAIMMKAFSHCVTGLQSGKNTLDHFINVSADLLRHQEIVSDMLEAAQQHCGACAGLLGQTKPLVIEITERELLADIETARELLLPFIDFGLRMALDDFGSGFSSYQYLADLPISFLKIDGSLIKRIREKKVRAIVQGIQDTADQLEIITLAEFVEDQETESILKDIGVHWAQGFYYGKPEVPEYESRNLITR